MPQIERTINSGDFGVPFRFLPYVGTGSASLHDLQQHEKAGLTNNGHSKAYNFSFRGYPNDKDYFAEQTKKFWEDVRRIMSQPMDRYELQLFVRNIVAAAITSVVIATDIIDEEIKAIDEGINNARSPEEKKYLKNTKRNLRANKDRLKEFRDNVLDPLNSKLADAASISVQALHDIAQNVSQNVPSSLHGIFNKVRSSLATHFNQAGDLDQPAQQPQEYYKMAYNPYAPYEEEGSPSHKPEPML